MHKSFNLFLFNTFYQIKNASAVWQADTKEKYEKATESVEFEDLTELKYTEKYRYNLYTSLNNANDQQRYISCQGVCAK